MNDNLLMLLRLGDITSNRIATDLTLQRIVWCFYGYLPSTYTHCCASWQGVPLSVPSDLSYIPRSWTLNVSLPPGLLHFVLENYDDCYAKSLKIIFALLVVIFQLFIDWNSMHLFFKKSQWPLFIYSIYLFVNFWKEIIQVI